MLYREGKKQVCERKLGLTTHLMLAWFEEFTFSSYVEVPFIIPRAQTQKTGERKKENTKTHLLGCKP